MKFFIKIFIFFKIIFFSKNIFYFLFMDEYADGL